MQHMHALSQTHVVSAWLLGTFLDIACLRPEMIHNYLKLNTNLTLVTIHLKLSKTVQTAALRYVPVKLI